MNLEGLELVHGTSFEMIEEALKNAEIEHNVQNYPTSGRGGSAPYFRKSLIQIPKKEDSEKQVRKVLGHPDHKSTETWFYHAEYKVQPDFDLRQLDGQVTFRRGDLVERTDIFFDSLT